MSTIQLYASQINKMEGNLVSVHKEVNSFRSDLLCLHGKMTEVDRGICDLNGLMADLRTSSDTQQLKSEAMEKMEKEVEDFIDFAERTDNAAADYIERAKTDFYKKYSWLKPESEKERWGWITESYSHAKEYCRLLLEKTKTLFQAKVLTAITELTSKLREVFGFMQKKAEPLLQVLGKYIYYIAEDIRNFDLKNTDEDVVLNSHLFSAYKGVFVLRHNISGSTSFSIGIMVINSNDINTPKAYWADKETVMHEYGHTVQLRILGPVRYILYIALPSVTAYYFGTDGEYYYDQLWERTADYFGGVDRGDYSSDSLKESVKYLASPELYLLNKAKNKCIDLCSRINQSSGEFQLNPNSSANP